MRITVIGECTHPAVLVKPFSPGSGITFVLGHVLATPLRAGMTLHRHGTDMLVQKSEPLPRSSEAKCLGTMSAIRAG